MENQIGDLPLFDIQVSADGATVWVHGADGSTVGRFSKKFGVDVHTSVTDQMQGASQCLNCTHKPATPADWEMFREDMMRHFSIPVEKDLIKWAQNEIYIKEELKMEAPNAIGYKIIAMDSTFTNNIGEVIEVNGIPGVSDRLTFSKAVDALTDNKNHGFILAHDETIYRISPVGQQLIKADIKIVNDEGSLTQARAYFQSPINKASKPKP